MKNDPQMTFTVSTSHFNININYERVILFLMRRYWDFYDMKLKNFYELFSSLISFLIFSRKIKLKLILKNQVPKLGQINLFSPFKNS